MNWIVINYCNECKFRTFVPEALEKHVNMNALSVDKAETGKRKYALLKKCTVRFINSTIAVKRAKYALQA